MRTVAGLTATLTALLLAGCGSPEPTPLPEDVDPAALVAKRYETCLADLEATPPVANDDGTTVTATIEGGILTWDVGQAPNTGDPLTVPADEATIAALESVDC